jgi:hypothetical protein
LPEIPKESEMRKIALLLVAFMALQSLGAAETRVPNEKQVARTRAKVEKIGIGEKSKVTVFLRDNSEIKGYVAAIDTDAFAVMEKKTKTAKTIAYADVASISGRASKKSIVIYSVIGVGAVVGIGIGVYAAMFTFGSGCQSNGLTTSCP